MAILNETVEKALPAANWDGYIRELIGILDECVTKDSSKLLQVEANIKSLMTEGQDNKNIFLILAALFTGGAVAQLQAIS